MTLQECYAALGGNFDDAISRLRSEKLVQKFVLKFLNDGSYDLLCQNLSFVRLQDSSAELTEALRDGVWSDQVAALYQRVCDDYHITAEAIRALAGQ